MNELNELLKRGAFLTCEFEGKVNSMTIGWGMEGTSWSKPVFVAMVRPSRYTYELLSKANTFTVSIPKAGEMKKEIGYFGSASGRNEDKIKMSGIGLADAKSIEGKVIEGCECYYECKVLYSQHMDNSCFLDGGEIDARAYKDGDYHYIVFGEIVAAY